MIDRSHDSARTSWVTSANGHPDFPIQNLPLCTFERDGEPAKVGVAIGDQLLDLSAVAMLGLSDGDRALVASACGSSLNAFLALPQEARRQLRQVIGDVLDSDASEGVRNATGLLVPAVQAGLKLPTQPGDFTDFFAGINHAVTAGRNFRPDNPLLPNYKYVPIAYHGRSSSVRVSGEPVVRPTGQRAGAEGAPPVFGPAQRLDYELELAIWVADGNALGHPIPIGEAQRHIGGFGLLNDWSARDIQRWETQPLGPFLGKSFHTTVSPYLVTTEALAPFRRAQPARPEGDPQPLAYLHDVEDQRSGAFDIRLEVSLSSRKMREEGIAPVALARSSGLDLYWTPGQMVTHHSSNGCELRAGDLFGTGTVSGPDASGHGSLLELTGGGRNPITLPSGEPRAFLEDGDEVIMRGWCEAEGFARIGFGEARGIVTARREAGA